MSKHQLIHFSRHGTNPKISKLSLNLSTPLELKFYLSCDFLIIITELMKSVKVSFVTILGNYKYVRFFLKPIYRFVYRNYNMNYLDYLFFFINFHFYLSLHSKLSYLDKCFFLFRIIHRYI